MSILSGAALWLVAGPALTAQPAQEPPLLGVTAEVIRLDVTVVDAEGDPVRGLGPGGFAVEAGGRLREILNFRYVDAGGAPASRELRGDYELVLEVQDRSTGSGGEAVAPFRLVAPE